MKPSRKDLLNSRSGSIEYHTFEATNIKDEEKRLHLLSKIEAIDKTLREVKDGKSFKVSQASLAPEVSVPHSPRTDNSYIIDTTAPQRTTCPHCFEVLPVRELRAHIQKFCTQKMVQCQEHGCNAILPQNEMKEHIKNGCVAAKKRRVLATVSIKRKEEQQKEALLRIEAMRSKPALPFQQQNNYEDISSDLNADRVSTPEDDIHHCRPKPPPLEMAMVQCDKCKDMLPTDTLKVHCKECRFRLIFCSNRHLGCMDEVPFCELHQHLRKSCPVEKHKNELVLRSRKRRKVVKCPGCGDGFELQYLRHHESNECPNRKVPCRNHALGCNFIVRLKDRKGHEDVNTGIKPRPCLFFDGQDTRMMIEEDDITPPWTAQFWIYRPSLLESGRCHVREVKRLGKLFRECALQECFSRAEVVALKNSLESLASTPGGIAEATAKLAQQLISYERNALNTCKYGQLLLVAATTASAEIAELVETRPLKDLVDILPNVTGKVYPKAIAVSTFDDDGNGSDKEEELKENEKEIEKRSQEINEQMMILRKALEEAEKSNENDCDAKSDVSERHGNEGSDDNHLPEGFDSIITNIDDIDWSPKRWRDWAKIMKDVLIALNSDQLVLRSWRVEVGLVRMTDEEKRALKKESTSGSIDDEKAKKEAAKAAKREKREKKKRKNAKEVGGHSSTFPAKYDSIQRVYSGSEPLCVGPDALIYLNLSDVPMPGKSNKKKKKDKSSDSDVESDAKGSKKKVTKNKQGTLGFADKIEGSCSFNIKIPREKWTHIIVKCTVEPKKRIFVYSNGVLVGTLKDHFFNLPMQSIGSEFLSFHGYLLDVRYWAKDRSSAEMKLDMHHLIELGVDVNDNESQTSNRKISEDKMKNNYADMSGDQLVGWWTFEDGFHSRSARDVSGNRFPSAIVGGIIHMSSSRLTHWFEAATLVQLSVREQIDNQRKLLAESQGDDDELKITQPPPLVIPMPSFLERNLCRFEVRRAKLAQKGRALMKEAKCPLGCKEKIRKVDMRYHIKYSCERRMITCRYPYCRKKYMAMDAWWHESTEDCAAIRSRDEILRKAQVDRQLFVCDMCSEKVQSRHFLNHQENLCPHRLIKCPHDDCDIHLFPAHTLQYHLEVKCRSAAVRERKMLIERARATRSYARPWGVAIRMYGEESDSDSEAEERGKEGFSYV